MNRKVITVVISIASLIIGLFIGHSVHLPESTSPPVDDGVEDLLEMYDEDGPSSEELANAYSRDELALFEPDPSASKEIKAKCAEIKEAFISSHRSEHLDMIDRDILDFRSTEDPILAGDMKDDDITCEKHGAYRPSFILDGEEDPGHGVKYLISATLSMPASIDNADMVDNQNVSLYSRYSGSQFGERPMTGDVCSIQDGSILTYLRSIKRGYNSVYKEAYEGQIWRYTRPTIPTVSTEGSRYTPEPECADGQLIVTQGLYRQGASVTLLGR